jgi:hypothetical protein
MQRPQSPSDTIAFANGEELVLRVRNRTLTAHYCIENDPQGCRLAYGATDEFGYKAIQNRVHVHDLHATVLHLLGLDHERLTYRYSGRDFRLTDVHGHVVKDILA